MTAPPSSAITPEAARILAKWAGLAATADRLAIFQEFRDRVQRLYAIDVEPVEFDFLRPID